MKISRITVLQVLWGKCLLLTIGVAFAMIGSLQAATLFSDNFDSYGVGALDSAFTTAYQTNISGSPFPVISSSTGLGGTQSFQNTADSTIVRKDISMNLAAGDSVTVNLFFQQNGAPSGAARPQIGVLGLSDGGGIFNGGSGGDLSVRIGGGNTLEFRANNAAAGVQSGVLSLADGWYNLQFQAIKSSTPNLFDLNAWLYSTDSSGNITGLITSISQTGFSNSTIYGDSSLFVGFRESSTILNMDNFSADITPVPEPGTATLLTLGGAAAFCIRRRVACA